VSGWVDGWVDEWMDACSVSLTSNAFTHPAGDIPAVCWHSNYGSAPQFWSPGMPSRQKQVEPCPEIRAWVEAQPKHLQQDKGYI